MTPDEAADLAIKAIADMTKAICTRLDEQTKLLTEIREMRAAAKAKPAASAPQATRAKKDEDVFTATGIVASCRRAMKDGEAVTTSWGAPVYWLSLTDGFKIRVTNELAAQVAVDASREGRAVVIEYTKSADGKYENFKKITKAASNAQPTSQRDDSADPF